MASPLPESPQHGPSVDPGSDGPEFEERNTIGKAVIVGVWFWPIQFAILMLLRIFNAYPLTVAAFFCFLSSCLLPYGVIRNSPRCRYWGVVGLTTCALNSIAVPVALLQAR